MDERRSRCPDIVTMDGRDEWLFCVSSCYESVVMVLNVLIWPRCYAFCLHLESDPLYGSTERSDPSSRAAACCSYSGETYELTNPTSGGSLRGQEISRRLGRLERGCNTGQCNRCRNSIAAFLCVITSRLSECICTCSGYNIVPPPLCTAPPLLKTKCMQPGISYVRLEITQLQTT
jgi:hypothetical protein